MKTTNVEDIYELSPLQQGMLFHCLFAPESALYFEQVSMTLEGGFHLSAFEHAWREVVARNPILRTGFHWEGLEKPLQVVYKQVDLPLQHFDWRRLTSAAKKRKLTEFLKQDRALGLKLDAAPLMRLALLRTGDGSYEFVWSFHHILLDGWSLPLLLQEFTALYDAYRLRKEPHLESRRPFSDYIGWLQQQDSSPAEIFWRRALAGYKGPTRLFSERSVAESHAVAEDYADQAAALSMDTTVSLQKLARQHQITLNTIVQGAWALILNRFSGAEDVVFGAIVSGRPAELSGVESMVGMFINTLPVRVRVRPEAELISWLKELHAWQFEMRQYEHSPLVSVQGWSEVPRGQALFNSILVFENYPTGHSLQPKTSRSAVKQVRAIERTNYPLGLIAGLGPELLVKLLYDCQRFERDVVVQLLKSLCTLLDGIAAGPSARLADLPMQPEEERQRLARWNRTQSRYPGASTVHGLFEEQVRLTPNALAVRDGGHDLTCGELDEWSSQLASKLRALDLRPEEPVGVLLHRSPGMVAALLAILKAGGAYVGLDVGYPPARLRMMAKSAALRVVLAEKELASFVGELGLEALYVGGPDLERGNNWARRNGASNKAKRMKIKSEVTAKSRRKLEIGLEQKNGAGVAKAFAENVAYLIFTSGSTGVPKGVMGLHRASVNRYAWMWDRFPFEPGEMCAVRTSLNFVDSVWEIFGPLLKGIPLVLISDEESKDPRLLIGVLSRHRVTRLVIVPSVLRELLELEVDLNQKLPHLKYWSVSGEELTADLVKLFSERVPGKTLINLYGSSEVAGDATAWLIDPAEECKDKIPIGEPIANTRVYVLDREMRAVPEGVPGEIYVGGDCLARGYVRAAGMTAERFLPDPFAEEAGQRMYRTGDLGRFVGGKLIYQGRVDRQVKVRGQRVELGEVEAAVRQLGGVRECAVEVVGEEARLVAYVVRDGDEGVVKEEEARAWREQLSGWLPGHMVPAGYMALGRLPLLPNGKVDRGGLRSGDWGLEVRGRRAERAEAETETEQRLLELWGEVLGAEEVGAEDGFFELGGHSLLATRLVGRVREEFGVEVGLRALFEAPTPRQFAVVLETIKLEKRQTTMPEIKPVARAQYRTA